jgi:hypothetical protein
MCGRRFGSGVVARIERSDFGSGQRPAEQAEVVHCTAEVPNHERMVVGEPGSPIAPSIRIDRSGASFGNTSASIDIVSSAGVWRTAKDRLAADDHDITHTRISRGSANDMLKLRTRHVPRTPGGWRFVRTAREPRRRDSPGVIGLPALLDQSELPVRLTEVQRVWRSILPTSIELEASRR